MKITQDTLLPNRGSKKNVGGLTPLVPFNNKLQLWEFNPFEKNLRKLEDWNKL